MSKLIKTAGLAMAIVAVAASSAVATTGPAMYRSRAPIGVGSNTAAVAGNTGANLGPAVFALGGGSQVGCADSGLHITTPVPTNTLHVTPTFSSCVLSVAGTALAAVTIDHNCEWTVTSHPATFNTTTGLSTGSTIDLCETTLTAPSIGCTIHVTKASLASSVAAQNITSTGANDTSASPWGSKITTALSGLHYITTVHPGGTCGSIPSTSNASYSSSVYLRNVWSSL